MKTYTIKKIDGPITSESWKLAETAVVDYIPNSHEISCPYHMEARLLYDDEAIYVNLATDERPLYALHNEPNTSVCKDSCMEFFLSPDQDDPHYLNFEMNPITTLLLYYCADRNNYTEADVDHKIFDAKSVITQKDWQLFYKIPFDFLLKYFKKIDNEFHGNFYKCGDETIIQHYATWNPVTCPEVDFHRPEYFGKLIFEKGISVNR